MNHESGGYSNPILFFDGVCNLCNKAVDFIIRRDKNRIFRYASLQSDIARALLPASINEKSYETIYVLVGEQILAKSNAVFYVAEHLDGWPKLLKYMKWVPSNFADAIYTMIAKNRYKVFGKRESCRLPKEEEKALFLA